MWITFEGFSGSPDADGFYKADACLLRSPELIHRINQDLLDFNLGLLDRIDRVCRRRS